MPRPVHSAPLHSLAEACLYARVTPCAVCGGPLDCDGGGFEHDIAHNLLDFRTTCRTCGADFHTRFDTSQVLPSDWATLRAGRIANPWDTPAAVLNPTEQESQVIDLAGWLKLFTIMADEARSTAETAVRTEERSRARQMRRVADACLDEALKFFDADNDLPPDEAFFTDESRRQFWERPQLFTRQHIAELRFSLMRSQG